jgi:hypothetical protein
MANSVLTAVFTPLSPSMMKPFRHLSYITTYTGSIINIFYNPTTKHYIAIMSDKTWYIKPGALIKTTLAELLGLYDDVMVKMNMIDVATTTGFPYLDLIKDEWIIYDRTWAYYAEKNLHINFNVEMRTSAAEQFTNHKLTADKLVIEQLASVFYCIARKLTLPYPGSMTEETLMEEFERMKDDNIHQAAQSELLRPWN